MTRKEAALAFLNACRYSTGEVNCIWDRMYPDLVDYRPRELEPKLDAISQALAFPRSVPFPDGVVVPDDDDMGFRQTNDVSDYLRS